MIIKFENFFHSHPALMRIDNFAICSGEEWKVTQVYSNILELINSAQHQTHARLNLITWQCESIQSTSVEFQLLSGFSIDWRLNRSYSNFGMLISPLIYVCFSFSVEFAAHLTIRNFFFLCSKWNSQLTSQRRRRHAALWFNKLNFLSLFVNVDRHIREMERRRWIISGGLKSMRVGGDGEGVRKCLSDPSSFLGRVSILSH